MLIADLNTGLADSPPLMTAGGTLIAKLDYAAQPLSMSNDAGDDRQKPTTDDAMSAAAAALQACMQPAR